MVQGHRALLTTITFRLVYTFYSPSPSNHFKIIIGGYLGGIVDLPTHTHTHTHTHIHSSIHVLPSQMIPGAANTLSSALARFPLGSGEVLDEEPLYVNAKQYHRILKRRQARAKLEAEGKIPKQRQVHVCIVLALWCCRCCR